MKSFEEFMHLHTERAEDSCTYLSASAKKWLLYYELSKQAYDKYGEVGPPKGSLVRTLVSGHCGGVFEQRIFSGDAANDPNYFLLTVPDNTKIISLVRKAHWYLDIVPDQGAEWAEEIWQRIFHD